MQLIGGIDSTGLYATVAQDYLYDNAGTAAREPISALRAKQDALTFNYNVSNQITGINNSAIGGGGGTSFTGVTTASPITGDGLNSPLGLDYTSATYGSDDLINAIGSTGLYATSAANSNKLNGQQAGYYCTDANAKIYSNFAGGNGITVAGELTQTKTINSNLTEYQLQEGVGITYEVDDVNEIVKFHAKPEIFLYYTTSPIMASSTAIAFSTTSAAYNSKSGTVGINNSEITGLDSTKLYHCNVKLIVENVDSTPATVSVKATNWNNNDSITYEYVNSNNSGTMELDWYIKGLTGCSLTGGGLSTAIQAGVKEIMITEVCYA